MLKLFDGKKTYLAALGLLGLGVSRLAAGDLIGGVQSLLEAAVAAGLRQGMAQSQAQGVAQPQAQQPQ